MAEVLGIERESYYRLERQPYTISAAGLNKIADELGVRPDQLWFHPPTPGHTKDVDLNDLVAGLPDDRRDMIIAAVRGMVGK